jgi:hypothetical protein
MKKLITAFLVFASLMASQAAFASGPFNGQDGDCPGLGIGNYTTGTGIADGQWKCWTTTSVSASAGQVINVGIFYHNNTNSTLTNAKASLSQSSTGPGTSFSFTGNLSSDQGSTPLGTVTLNLNSSQTVTFNSAYLYNNKQHVDNHTDVPFPGGQSESALMNGGISIGNVPPGWEDYGMIVAVFRVGTTSTVSTCQDSSATNYGGSLPCTYPQTTCSISTFTVNGSTTSTTISSGSPVTINWSTNGYSSVTVTGPNFSSSNTSGNQLIYPTSSGTYTLTAYGSGNGNCGYQTRTVQVNINSIFIPTPPAICAVTTIATNVTRNTAILNGSISGNTNGTGYFEYGPTIAMGFRTPTRTISSGFFTETITGLTSGTPYYFRFVANCGNGFSNGTIQTFRTQTNIVTTTTTVRPPVVVQGTTVIGTSSPIMLTIEDRYEFLGVGDIIDYTVTYRNIGSTLLTRPVLQVVVPKGIVITNASRGSYSADTNTLTVQLEDLYPGAGGVVYLQGHVDYLAIGDAQIVTTAILVYTSPSGAQENAIAYVLNRPKMETGNNLGAAAFFAGIFPSTLLGWLLLLLIILLIVLATRRYYHKRTVVVPQPPYNSMNH